MSDVHPIRAFRKASGITLEELSQRLGAITGQKPSTANLSKIENGKLKPALELLPAIRQITGVQAEQLRPEVAKLFRQGRSK